MIYDFPAADDAIVQGDIFRAVPRIDLELSDLSVIDADEQTTASTWSAAVANEQDGVVTALVAIRPVLAIVVTQDCDAVRSPDLTLCEINPFREVEKRSAQTNSTNGWQRMLTQHARINQKWYYLPPDKNLGFEDKMAVDFRTTLRVGREDLEALKAQNRIGRLNETALAHFRERIGEFFRRYPYDEWYPLDREELAAYQKEKGDEEIPPYPWQKEN